MRMPRGLQIEFPMRIFANFASSFPGMKYLIPQEIAKVIPHEMELLFLEDPHMDSISCQHGVLSFDNKHKNMLLLPNIKFALNLDG